MTRRALIKRGAVVGAVVWTTPILQTALAPAASASHCSQCVPLGGTCSPISPTPECQVGLECPAGRCVIVAGGSGCTAHSDCASGVCSGSTCLAWPGATCSTNSQCASGKCAGGQCFANGLWGACRITSDCTDNTQCGSTKICGGVGALCANNNKCTTDNCQGGYCV